MLKKWTYLLLGILLILSISGCKKESPAEGEKIVSIYYVNNEETKVGSYEYGLKAETLEEQMDELVEQMKTLPDKLNYKSVLTMGFELNSYKVKGGQLILDVNEQYRMMSATTEVLVRAALVRNFTQLEGIENVIMTIKGEAMTDNLGNVLGVMAADNFIDNEGNQINSYERVKLKLYYANEAGNKLVAVNRSLSYNSNIPMEKLVVEELISGTGFDEAYPIMNETTKIISISVQDGICYVNFDGSFLNQTYNVTAEVTVYAIANSLVELPNVNKVQISVNGTTDIMYMETLSLSNYYERNLDLME